MIRLTTRAWSLVRNKAKGMRVSSRMLSRALKKAKLKPDVRAFTEQDAHAQLKEAYRLYYSQKGRDKELRQTALENLAEAIAERGNISHSQVLKSLREREKQRTTDKKIRYLQGTLRTGSTTMVMIVDQEGNKINLTKKQDIEQAILDNNLSKFLQSSKTPFYLTPLKEEFGFKGLTSSAQAVLAGVYDSNHNIDTRILEVIKQRQLPESVRELRATPMHMSLESYRRFWKKAREETACFPGPLSFSTMKAGAFNEQIAEMDWTLTRFPLEVGFAPKRWKQCVDVMLLKKSGMAELSSLPTIVLFPVDCNFAFKHVGKEMMKIAEQTKSLASEQYGSRKRHRAIDLAVNKALTFDILRQLKRAGAICSNDAKSCYNLIGHTQAAISMQRVGVPRNIINCLFTTLQEAVHRVRTGFGDSKATY